MTSTPVVAAFAAVIANLALVTAPLLGGLSDQPFVRRAVARIDVLDHHKSAFLAGVLDTSYFAFFVAWTLVFLFLAVRAVEARRWRKRNRAVTVSRRASRSEHAWSSVACSPSQRRSS